MICSMCNTAQNAAANLNNQSFLLNSVTGCGHYFCRECVDITFARQRKFPCPKCHLIVKLSNLTEKTLDETEVERDFKVRKRVKAVFNKRESDFKALLDFNNYEEKVEDIIYNLTNGIDEVAINKHLDEFRLQNAKEIAMNQSKIVESERKLSNTIKDEEQQKMTTLASFQELDSQQKIKKQKIIREKNAIMLGEADDCTPFSNFMDPTNTNPPVAVVGTGSAGLAKMNPIQLFLLQRNVAEPKPSLLTAEVEERMKAQAAKDSSKQQLRSQHTAGGFDYSHYRKRNMYEFMSVMGRI